MANMVLNINGVIQPFELKSMQPAISPFDRSYLYGDSLYEVARTYNGRFCFLEEHLTRLAKSAELCKMVLNQELSEYQRQIERTFAAFQDLTAKPSEAYMRIVVSRGVGRIGFGISCLLTPTQYTIIVQPVEQPSPEQYAKGFHLQISTRLRNDTRALEPAMKSGNYLNSLLAYLDAASDNFDDALLCNQDGHLTEGTTFNIFYIKRGIVVTPPLDIGILDGITRRHVLKVAHEMKFDVREIRFPKERLYEADEVFITSSVREVFPVTKIDRRAIANGLPGPITAKLHEGYLRAVEKNEAV